MAFIKRGMILMLHEESSLISTELFKGSGLVTIELEKMYIVISENNSLKDDISIVLLDPDTMKTGRFNISNNLLGVVDCGEIDFGSRFEFSKTRETYVVSNIDTYNSYDITLTNEASGGTLEMPLSHLLKEYDYLVEVPAVGDMIKVYGNRSIVVDGQLLKENFYGEMFVVEDVDVDGFKLSNSSRTINLIGHYGYEGVWYKPLGNGLIFPPFMINEAEIKEYNLCHDLMYTVTSIDYQKKEFILYDPMADMNRRIPIAYIADGLIIYRQVDYPFPTYFERELSISESTMFVEYEEEMEHLWLEDELDLEVDEFDSDLGVYVFGNSYKKQLTPITTPDIIKEDEAVVKSFDRIINDNAHEAYINVLLDEKRFDDLKLYIERLEVKDG